MTETIQEKIDFVKDLNPVITTYFNHVKNIYYDALEFKAHPNVFEEFLVVEFNNGAKSARRSNMNSKTAIIEDLMKIINNMNEYELDYYQDCKERDIYK